MPPLKDVDVMITAARSRNVRFTMIIQNFAQLDDVYGKDEAETIRGNCGNIIYLITTELKALEEISKMCGEEKSKKDDKTASTPLVTVSDLQRMKKFEVIILRLRKQPFKTKFTPYYKLNWGKTYPLAKYPKRPKKEVHTFDIKEYVKNQKKKKLLEMMNSADEKDKENASMDGMDRIPRMNPMNEQLPPELRALRGRNSMSPSDDMIPDFLRRERKVSEPARDSIPGGGVPSFEDFKNQMESGGAFNPFAPESFSTSVSPSTAGPRSTEQPKTNGFDDDLGFDVDELVRKIDAKIAELEEEENRQKEEEKKREKKEVTPAKSEDKKTEPPKIEKKEEVEKKEETPLPNTKPSPDIHIEEDDEDDDFFDDFFDN